MPAATAAAETGTEVEQLRRQVGALELALQSAQAAHGQALERMATMKVGQRYGCTHGLNLGDVGRTLPVDVIRVALAEHREG